MEATPKNSCFISRLLLKSFVSFTILLLDSSHFWGVPLWTGPQWVPQVLWLLIFPIKHWQPLGLLREKPHFQRPMRELLVDDGCPNSRLTWVYACIYSWMGLYTPTNITRQPLRTADCEKPWKSWQDRIAQAEQTDDHSRGGPKVSARKLPQFDPQSFRSISTSFWMLGPRELQV